MLQVSLHHLLIIIKNKEEIEKTPKKAKRAGSATPGSTHKKRLKLTPMISSRQVNVAEPTSPLGEIRRRLHVSAVPQTLPCREDEFSHIFSYVEGISIVIYKHFTFYLLERLINSLLIKTR